MNSNSKIAAFPEISVRNLQRIIPVKVVDLGRFAVRAMRSCLKRRKRKNTELTKLPEIFVYLISDRRMALLHRQFLHQTGPSDVLTFDHGEIFISVEAALRNARVFGNSLGQELRLCLVHGLLHLHGFDDRTRASAQKMEKAQQKILQQLS
jgi:probable rRNA maturation factor